MVAMALMTLQVVAPGAAIATSRRASLLSKQQPSSWVCRATSKEEGSTPDAASAVSDVANAIQEAVAVAVPAAPAALAAEASVESTTAAPISNEVAAPSKPAELTGAAAWYQAYGRSVPSTVDARDFYYGADRPLWKGPFTQPKDVPEWLTGEFPGDYGCDIFRLVRLPQNYARLRSQELMNGRWAMLGIVGCLAPELINSESIPGYEPVWFKAGAQIFSDAGIDYLGSPGFINAHSLFAVVVSQALLMGGAEWARVRYVPEGVDPFYPGGNTFDPLGFATDPEILAELKVKEIKNGRLAMLAIAGLFAQGALTGVSPLQNFHDYFHI